MKKLNWGTWIVICFILFAVGTATMVYISMTTNVDLVAEDYYEKELKYQDHIRLVNNTKESGMSVGMSFTETSLVLAFPKGEGKYSGTIHFFRPSDKRGDFSRAIELDSSFAQSFPLSVFNKGFWRAKISWSAGEEDYYSELPIIIQ